MTDTMILTKRCPLTGEAHQTRRVRAAAQRRRAARINTLLEALSTIGLGVCILLCGVLLLCAV